MNVDKHQASLDGIRGFAAISVVLYHLGHWLHASLAPNSGLAVDLFYLLSGYVLTLAYARRLDDGMTLEAFLLVRLVRLMPLVVLGTLISAAYLMLRIHVKHEELTTSALITSTLLGAFNLPDLTAPPSIGGNQVFPLNGPQYSLFFEIVANAAWACSASTRRWQIAAPLSFLCFALVLAAGTLGGDTPDTFLAGFPRVGASFLAGVAIFHVGSKLPAWRGWPIVFWICCALMLATFYAPPLPFGAGLLWAMTVSPLLVLSGARTILRGRTREVALLGGRLSYPIYILHYPLFVWANGLFQTFAHRQNLVAEGMLLLPLTLVGCLFILSAYDEPIRRRLSARLR